MHDTAVAFWLSPQQKVAWQLREEQGIGNAIAVVRMRGALRPERLREALNELVNRHEILRTVFRRMAGMKVPFQIVLDSCDPSWSVAATADLEAVVEQERMRAVALDQGPVLCTALCQLGTQEFALVLALPGLCCDTYTLEQLVHELGLLYAGRELKAYEESLPYRHFAQWQNEALESDDEDAREARQYWKDIWATQATPVSLPSVTSAATAFLEERVSVSLSGVFLQQLNGLGADGADVLLAAWQSFIWRLTGNASFLVSLHFGGRHFKELAGTLGPIERFAPLAVCFEGDLQFREVLAAARQARGAAEQRLEHAGTTADAVPVAFCYREQPAALEQYAGVEFALGSVEVAGEPYTLQLVAGRQTEHWQLELVYDAARLARQTVERWSEQFQVLLRAAVEQPEQVVSRLPLLSQAERQRVLVEWNQTAAEYPQERCFHELFEAQAARTPDRPAVRCGASELSYRQLNERSNQLAQYLRQLGVKPDARVGVLLQRSVDLLVAVLGILKAGGAYVALQAEHPPARLQQQLQGAVALLSERNLAGQLPEFGGAMVCLEEQHARWQQLPTGNLEPQSKPDNLVYVIYTSGSTGTPKGVMVRHRNLVNYAWAVMRRLGWDQSEEPLQCATVSTLSADLGNTCIFPAWLAGGCVHVIGPEMATDGRALGQYFSQQQIDVLKIVPSHWRALLDAGGGREMLPRRFLILGGEALTPGLLERIAALGGACQVVNHYGPTETTVGSLLLPVNEYDWRQANRPTIPIGRPLANTRIYVLDGYRQPVPVGMEGELYIAGAGVTAGYLNQPEQTGERFLDHSWLPGEQMYRTGDRVRYLPDGLVEFLGRVDEQVKIRGYRVEPGEVEAVLGQHPAVRQAVVLARDHQTGDQQLVAYVVNRTQPAVSSEQLLGYLKERLPEYLLPSALLLLEKLPLTANGKLDRKALPSPEQMAAARRDYQPPQTATEQRLAAIWEQVLRRERVGRNDNFFDIGGHSLLATQIISRVREQFGVNLAVGKMFEEPTLRLLSCAIDLAATSMAADAEEEEDLVPIARDAYRRRGD